MDGGMWCWVISAASTVGVSKGMGRNSKEGDAGFGVMDEDEEERRRERRNRLLIEEECHLSLPQIRSSSPLPRVSAG